MLIELEIKDFALIEHIQVTFCQGLNVLTGETGAGKSIIIDALNCLLGGKAGPSIIRLGKEKASLEASFSLSSSISAWLKSHELYEEGNVLTVSREISKTGSKIRINGSLVNVALVSDLRQQLFTVHAQHEAATLMSPQSQLELLDGLADESHQKLLQKTKTLYARVQELENQVKELSLSEAELAKRLDFITFQLGELKEANLDDPNEDTKLASECQILANVVELANLADSAQSYLIGSDSDESPAAITLVQQAALALRQASELDEKLIPVVEAISNCVDALEEGKRSIRHYKESLDTDPESLSQLQARLGELSQIKRKYGPNLSDAIEIQEKLEIEIDKLQNSQTSLDSLNKELEESHRNLLNTAEELSNKRKALAKRLGKNIEAELIELGMTNCRFEITISPANVSASGVDKIEFLIAPNPGQPLLPLSKIASGGELSRIMLAVKSIFAKADQVSTVVFDEIDAGLSGKILQIMAKKLAQLAHSHQILCITHQPIVASVANGHIKVNKKQSANKTDISVAVLNKEQRIKELANMASGHEDKEEALLFAQSLFEANSPIK